MSSLDKLSLLDIVSEYTKPIKVGSTYFALCPFHSETKPSFHIDPVRNLYYCHGCQRGGNLKTFLREVGRLYEFEEETIFDVVAKYWNWILLNSEPLLKKLKEIGINEPEIKKYRIGYSLGKTYQYLQKKGFSENEISSLGIFKNNQEKFERRLIFPVTDKGKIKAFVARSSNGEPKYLYSAGSKIKDYLFGLDQNEAHIRRKNKVYVVEGVRDFFAVQDKYPNSVCSFGCHLSFVQMVKLSRVCDEVVFMFDGDNAGREGVLNSVSSWDSFYPLLSVALLPKGKDPFELKQEGLIDEVVEVNLPSFYFKEGKNVFDLAKDIAKASREIVLEELVNETQEVYKISRESLLKEINRFRPKDKKIPLSLSPEEIVVAYSLQNNLPLSEGLLSSINLRKVLNHRDPVEEAKLSCVKLDFSQTVAAFEQVLNRYLISWIPPTTKKSIRELLIAFLHVKRYLKTKAKENKLS